MATPNCWLSLIHLLIGVTVFTTAGCASGGGTRELVLQVRTDYVAGLEFDQIEVRIDDELVSTHSLVYQDTVRDVLSAGDYSLGIDTYLVEVTLRNGAGGMVGFARISVLLDPQNADDVTLVIVPIQRSCGDVRCGDSLTCFRGECVAPECAVEVPPESCDLVAECVAGMDCTQPSSTCLEAACVVGTCFNRQALVCEPGQACLPEQGCVPVSSACLRDERVENGACVACPAGSTNEPGDDPAGDDTMCAERESDLLKANNVDASDEFGFSVAVDGDLMVVGAPGEASRSSNGLNSADNSMPGAGAIYIFRRVDGAWQFEDYYTSYRPQAGAHFGASVAVSNNVIVVGVPDWNEQTGYAELVYESESSPGSWLPGASLRARFDGTREADPGDRFGATVAIHNGIVAVGAPGEDSAATGVDGDRENDSLMDSGAVYMFHTSTGQSGGYLDYIKAMAPDAGDGFGSTVAIHNNVVAIGVPGDDSGNNNYNDNSVPNSGAVYIYSRRQGFAFVYEAFLKPSSLGSGYDFSGALAIYGDRLAVGAPATPGGGRVHLFERATTNWMPLAAVVSSNIDVGDRFGCSISLAGDTMLVGALGESSLGGESDNSGNEVGAAYLFSIEGAMVTQSAYIQSTNRDSNDRFGTSIDHDGTTVVIGAPGEDTSGSGVNPPVDNNTESSGAAYVF